MRLINTHNGFLLEAKQYTARLLESEPPALDILREGKPVFKLPIASGLGKPGVEERLSDIHADEHEQTGTGRYELKASAKSSLWEERGFHWAFFEDHIEFYQHASGEGSLGRCYFFSNDTPDTWNHPEKPGVEQHMTIYPEYYFSPVVNHANRYYHSLGEPQSVGILNEAPMGLALSKSIGGVFLPDQIANLFCPPPLALVFGEENAWASVGLGEQPGKYQFNSLEYSGSRFAGAAFHINYNGYSSIGDRDFNSPVMAIHFGYSEYEALEEYIQWLDRRGYTTRHRYTNADWHREPIFCGWAEQTAQSRRLGVKPSELATQENYETWIAILEDRQIPFGTIVIDDKWQEAYGNFQVDTHKWPDMKGFIDRQHAEGRHVLLWVPGHFAEGLDDELCIFEGGKPIAGDVSNPAYEAYLRQQIRHLMLETGADGFKEDWIGGVTVNAGIKTYAPLYGIEFLRRFQYILHDEAHRCKPDALIETQTPNPLFRESSDVLRLNDIYFGTRNVTEMMKIRARIARAAGWSLIDCDNASSTCLNEWWDYMQAQPSIGIPSLYFVHCTESTHEEPIEAQWAYLAKLWEQYRRDQLPIDQGTILDREGDKP